METDCDENSPECSCPCQCGCQNDPKGHCLPFNSRGWCASCVEGKHEIPPSVYQNLDNAIEGYESLLAQLKALRAQSR
jgi:hypothetical protein